MTFHTVVEVTKRTNALTKEGKAPLNNHFPRLFIFVPEYVRTFF